MGFTPVFDTVEPHEPLPHSDSIVLTRPTTRAALRFGGLTMDPVQGVVHFRGHIVSLSRDERETLTALLRRAGQIVSRERLAAMMSVRVDTVDKRVQGLRATLKSAGVSCLPIPVDGLGYILWRC